VATFRHVLAATDFSDASRGALRLASSLARDSDADLTIVHVCEVPRYEATGPILYDLVTPLVVSAQSRLDDLLRDVQHDRPGATGLVKVGAAWEEVLAVARELHADLIVMGTHGRRGLAHAFLGSVAEHVVQLSPVPVLTVRSDHPP
jgi:nucleotide-binding universal stress UspA family protein